MTQVPSPEEIQAMLDSGAQDDSGDQSPDVETPAQSRAPSQTEPFSWGLDYMVTVITNDGQHWKVPISSLAWEEQAGELAMRITVHFPDAPMEDGSRLTDKITLGCYLTVFCAFGTENYTECGRGIIEEFGPNDGTSGTFEVVAYDPIKVTLNNKVNAFFPADQKVSDMIELLFGNGEQGSHVPMGTLHDALKTATLPQSKTYHAQSLADILNDLVKIAQTQAPDNIRLVITTHEGAFSVVTPGTNTRVFWIRQDPDQSMLNAVRERFSITDLVTRLQVYGRSNEEGVPMMIEEIDNTEGTFGITRSDILEISQYMDDDAVKKLAQQTMNQSGVPKHDRAITAPDIPWVRKYDQIRVTAGTMDGHFSVESVSHDEGNRTMQITLGTLQTGPNIGHTNEDVGFHSEAIPEPGGSGGGGGAGYSGGPISPSQLYALAKKAGFDDANAITAVAVSLAEDPQSDPGIHSPKNQNGTVDLGLWQINSIHWGKPEAGGASEAQLTDPLTNAKAAYGIWKAAGGSWQPWSTFTGGQYRNHMDAAIAASKAPPASIPAAPQQLSGTNSKLAGILSQYRNVKYVWGGNSTAGVDCSGLTQQAYMKMGVSLPRTALAQWQATTHVPTPSYGDLVFFKDTDPDHPSPVTHVAIYIGGGQMLSAQDPVVKTVAFQGNPWWMSRLVGYGHVDIPKTSG